MRQVDEYFTPSPNIRLYHYSGISALSGIVNSKRLWASNVLYLNDSAEISQALDLLKNKILSPRLAFIHHADDSYEFLKQLNAWVDFCTRGLYFANLFIFSLSEMPSLLSQWRSYTPHGKGVSLGFSPGKIAAIAQTAGFKIAKCLYQPNEHLELLSSLYEKLWTSFLQEKNRHAFRSPHFSAFFEKYRNDIFQVLSIIKHHSFAEEREWRLISRYLHDDALPKIKFREGASMLVPYVEIELTELSKPWFDEVVLGPSPHPTLSLNALDKFLHSENLALQVIDSGIPYREWK